MKKNTRARRRFLKYNKTCQLKYFTSDKSQILGALTPLDPLFMRLPKWKPPKCEGTAVLPTLQICKLFRPNGASIRMLNNNIWLGDFLFLTCYITSACMHWSKATKCDTVYNAEPKIDSHLYYLDVYSK